VFLSTKHNYALVIWASRFFLPRDPGGLPRARLAGSETLLLIDTERIVGLLAPLEADRWLVAATDVATEPDLAPLLEALEAALWTLAAAAAEGAAEADAFVLPMDVAADTLEADRTEALPLPPGGGGGWLLEEEAFTFTFDATDLERDLAPGVFVFSLAADADLERVTEAFAGAGLFSSCATSALVLMVLLTLVRNLPALALALAFAFGIRTASSEAAAATAGSSAGYRMVSAGVGAIEADLALALAFGLADPSLISLFVGLPLGEGKAKGEG